MIQPPPRASRSVPQLSTLPLFAGVPEPLIQLVATDSVRHFSHRQALFHQGEEPDGLVLLLRGDVHIIADGTFLVARHPYDIVGEQAFIEGTKRSATAEAQGHVEALAIRRPLLERLMQDPVFNRNLLRILSEKLSQATQVRAYRFRQQELLFSEFQAHTSREVTDHLLSTGENYGKPRFIDAVVLFSDIRQFTDRCGTMTPDEIADQLSPYLDTVVEVIHRHGGLVDKFIGDAVMAIWGYTAGEGDEATQALACAEEMVRKAAELTFGGHPIQIGVGLNAGQVFIGNVGGDGKRQFTVLGSPVNLAARFESETKALQVPIVAGQDFHGRLPPELQAKFTKHEGRPIKGVEAQTLYSYDPAGAPGPGGKG